MTPNTDDDALIRHVVRYCHWLPACKRRRDQLPPARRLEYFTFVGSRPLDVLLLAVASVLPHSADTGFNAVKFFDRNGDDPSKTVNMIPGARAFPGPFVRTVLADEATPLEEPGQVAAGGSAENDEYQLLIDTQTQFKKYCPFDVINFDLEAVLFHEGEQPPGRLLRALSKLFEWQAANYGPRTIDAFSLMVSIPLASSDVDQQVKDLLRDVVEANIQRFPPLESALFTRVGVSSVEELTANGWAEMFAVAMPKVIIEALIASGWALSSSEPIELIRREQTTDSGATEVVYHLILDVERNNNSSSDPKDLPSYEAAVKALCAVGPRSLTNSDITPQVRTSFQQVLARTNDIVPI